MTIPDPRWTNAQPLSGSQTTNTSNNSSGGATSPAPAVLKANRNVMPKPAQQSAPVAIARSAIGQMQMMPTLRPLKPAPPKPVIIEEPKKTNFFDLPAELRIEIYKLVLDSVVVHVLPPQSHERHCPHALNLTSRQVRNEVIPIIHATCEIRAVVTDFNFVGLLAWLDRIPSQDQRFLEKNDRLSIRLCTSNNTNSNGSAPGGDAGSLRRWLTMRADPYRAQPRWRYTGPSPNRKIANDMKRKAKRMSEIGKKHEMIAMLSAVGMVIRPAKLLYDGTLSLREDSKS
ncbi:hypothetical protein D0859_13495 [Hortaea werneckii]|uniref:F-box domain-containing protein n=1 Tax=Hortaea werneckii TaxID=91943 RepID=A0A3M7IAM4_HORWE|nr:hypothetical protein D0859_13495 [Hortaea werneckii]